MVARGRVALSIDTGEWLSLVAQVNEAAGIHAGGQRPRGEKRRAAWANSAIPADPASSTLPRALGAPLVTADEKIPYPQRTLHLVDSCPRILVIDDNPSVGTALDVLFSLHEIRCLRGNAAGRTRPAAREDVDLVIQDMNFHADTTSGDEGVALFHQIRSASRPAGDPAHRVDAAGIRVELVKAGAADYLAKPWDDRKLVATVNNLLELGESRANWRRRAPANASAAMRC